VWDRQCVAVCCSVLQCVAVCCSVLQCVAVCCSVLQCVAVHTHRVGQACLLHIPVYDKICYHGNVGYYYMCAYTRGWDTV